MGDAACYACDASATGACQSCRQPSCDRHLKRVFSLGSELTWAALFGFQRARPRDEIEERVCSDCHRKLRRRHVRMLLWMLLFALFIVLVAPIAVAVVVLIVSQILAALGRT